MQDNLVLEEFKSSLLKDNALTARHDDSLLLRFLSARNFSIPDAKNMLLATEEWRQKEKVEEILSFDFYERDRVSEFFVHSYHRTFGWY